MEIYKEFSFDSAHFLPYLPEDHKCRQIHGHTYTLRVYLKGNFVKDQNWIMDFKELKNTVLPTLELVDHKLLNEIQGLHNPTAENITVWFWEHLQPVLPLLSRIELKETATSGVIYNGK
jgi:6-pyruvoyltetrahydropterin/6-carboxytetrahydropterin synthase